MTVRFWVIFGILLTIFTTQASADPNWTAGTFTQTCNELFNESVLNTSIWTPGITAPIFFGDGAMDLDLPSNLIMLPGGGLRIAARHQNYPATAQFGSNFTSGFTTGVGGGLGCGYQKYGWFESKMKLPSIAGGANGTWPAFWFYGYDSGMGATEIDVYERFNSTPPSVGFDPTYVTTTFHAASGSPGSTYLCTMQNTSGWADTYHTWAMDWEPSYIKIYIDGTLCNTSAWQATAPSLNTNPSGNYTGSPIPIPTGDMYVKFDNIVKWTANPQQLSLMEAGNANLDIAYYKVWQQNSQIQAPNNLSLTGVTTDKAWYSPGDTITFTAKITVGNTAETSVKMSGGLYDLCGNNTYCASTAEKWGATATSASASMAPNTTSTFTSTLTLPTNIRPGVYIFSNSASDAAADGPQSGGVTVASYVVVGNPLPQ